MAMNVRFDTETIRTIKVFEEITGVNVRDCVVTDDWAYFVVEEGKAGLAIGKNGKTIKKAQKSLDKHVKVYEYSSDPEKFIRNLVPAKVEDINIKDNSSSRTVYIQVGSESKPKVVGREGKNIKIIERFLKRSSDITAIKVR